MTLQPLTSLEQVRAAIAALPPPAAGKTRVFRGQTADYPTIMPAAYRTHLERSVIWQVYSRDLLSDISGQLNSGELNDNELRVLRLWLEAIAQHYGSGSHYLDTTQNIESALWFALHSGSWITRRNTLGPPGPPSPYDLPSETRWLSYTRSADPGFLYAFDVEVWDGQSATPPDLALIDLSQAPDPLRTPRMMAQNGCLILVGDKDQFDLRRHRVDGTPVAVGWPMTGSAYVERAAEEMFPSPATDNWYRRFLNIPLAPEIDSGSGAVVLRRPLPVTLYRGETQAYNDAVTRTESFLFPALIHRHLRRTAPADSGTEPWRSCDITEATPIVLEAPMLHALPPAGDLWNHELLMQDIAESVNTYAAAGGSPAGDVGLRNVLFQFSNFEETFWERARSTAEPTTLTRGIWIVRSEPGIVTVLLTQDFPGIKVEAWRPVRIRLGLQRRMEMTPVSQPDSWCMLADLPVLAKPVFVALHLLRALSPQPKPEATFRWKLQRSAPPAKSEYMVAIISDAARLIRVQDPAQVADWYVMRDSRGDPYTQAGVSGGSLALHASTAFADIPAARFREAMAIRPPEL